MSAFTLWVETEMVIYPFMPFLFLVRKYLVARNNNMEGVPNCCFFGCKSSLHSGLKVQNSFLVLKSERKHCGKDLWYVVFQGGLERFSFSLVPWSVDLKGCNLKQRLWKLWVRERKVTFSPLEEVPHLHVGCGGSGPLEMPSSYFSVDFEILLRR